jgi:DNA-3-methyladenine glycosylase II
LQGDSSFLSFHGDSSVPLAIIFYHFLSSSMTARHRFAKAERHLANTDPVMKRLIQEHGHCTIEPKEDHFFVLCDAIISQQFSVKASNTILGRFKTALGDVVTPEAVLAVPHEVLREVGCSGAKVSYLKDLAAHFAEGRLDTIHLATQSDEELIKHLTAVKGIGVWTAQMFMMFALCREDLFAADDVGLQNALKAQYGLDVKLVGKKALVEFATQWQPHRTVACWYLWRSLKNQ